MTYYCNKCFKLIEQEKDHQHWCPNRRLDDVDVLKDIFGF